MDKDKEKVNPDLDMQSISVNLTIENVRWLDKCDEVSGRKSRSNTLNFMLDNLRKRKNMGMKYDE